ncbi:hypothetical protein R3Q17_36325 [Rhodococcus opacus]|nr:hypothetical protein [Rhodococcus opacus]
MESGIAAALQRRFIETDARKRRLTGQPVEDTPESTNPYAAYAATLPTSAPDEAQQKPVVPLNGAQVLKAALAGGNGTTAPTVSASTAELISDALSARMDQAG